MFVGLFSSASGIFANSPRLGEDGTTSSPATVVSCVASSKSDGRDVHDAGMEAHSRACSSNLPAEGALGPWPVVLGPDAGIISLAETVRHAAKWLEEHGVVDPEPSATELLAKAAGFRSPQEMFAKRRDLSTTTTTTPEQLEHWEMTAAGWSEMRRLCMLRAAQHVPVQYLVGEWDFHRLSLEMQPPTLIPRPETEELVDIVLQWLRRDVIGAVADNDDGSFGGGSGCSGSGLCFLDVGSGTGAIGLALLNELRGARCVAVDAQLAAVQLSRRNAERCGLQDRYACFHATIAEFGLGGTGVGAGANPRATAASNTAAKDGNNNSSFDSSCAESFRGGGEEEEEGHRRGDNFDGSFDFIVSNPPYIPRRDMEALPRDVAEHEDSVALDGGDDGLDVVREIIQRCPRLLRRGGPRQLWMEVDTSHPEAMQRWLGLDVGMRGAQACDAQGVTRFDWMCDLSQRPRFVRLTFAEEVGDANR